MKVFCILSDHRAFKSWSPAVHTAVLARVGIPGLYVPFCVAADMLGDAVRGIRALGIAGANVTVPYKEAIIPFLDGLSPGAESIGAVNTVVRSGDVLSGHNTDADGFLESLRLRGFEPRGTRALVFGTGGATRAVLYALTDAGAAHVMVAGRDPQKTVSLARRFGALPVTMDDPALRSLKADLLVNTTSVSTRSESIAMADLVGDLSVEACRLVVDINYGRADNFWQAFAESRGIAFVDGGPMLACQARLSFALWTGVEVDAAVFMSFLEDR